MTAFEALLLTLGAEVPLLMVLARRQVAGRSALVAENPEQPPPPPPPRRNAPIFTRICAVGIAMNLLTHPAAVRLYDGTLRSLALLETAVFLTEALVLWAGLPARLTTALWLSLAVNGVTTGISLLPWLIGP